MDILSEIIHSSGLKGSLLTYQSFHNNWGYKFPCEKSFGFHIITQGTCIVRYKNTHKKLEKGDIVYITRGFSHALVSSLKQKAIPLEKLIDDNQSGWEQNLSPSCTIISVRYEPTDTIHPFFSELPDFIIVDANEIAQHHPIHSALVLISNEIGQGGGSELILQKLSDVLLYYILKYWVDKKEPSTPGWIKTFKDEKILHVLHLIHKYYSKGWTLDSLSDSIGISRASLAGKFKDALGITPLDYLSRVRIQKGKKLLEEKNYSLEEVARNVGYATGFSFSKAYKRIRGISPSLEMKKNKF